MYKKWDVDLRTDLGIFTALIDLERKKETGIFNYDVILNTEKKIYKMAFLNL